MPKNLLKISCRSCSQVIDADSRKGGVCPACNRFHQLPWPPEGVPTEDRVPGARTEFRRDGFSIAWRWPIAMRLVPFAVIAATLGITVQTFRSTQGSPGVFGAGLLLVGIDLILLYLGVAFNADTRTLVVNRSHVHTHCGPLWLPGVTETLPLSAIAFPVVYRYIQRGRNGIVSYTYAIRVQIRGGSERILVGDLHNPELTLWLERQLQRVLLARKRPLGTRPPG